MSVDLPSSTLPQVLKRKSLMGCCVCGIEVKCYQIYSDVFESLRKLYQFAFLWHPHFFPLCRNSLRDFLVLAYAPDCLKIPTEQLRPNKALLAYLARPKLLLGKMALN